ncbi:gp091 (endogenous virus) [Lactococcus phage KSY1]|uniref:Gp091 n=1 Tax=Lactococcus phage KSY1 TaxID=2913972 RepID=A6MAF6_9CAUD|nr:gp091 [Lactococcus phage KSY1]ABG21634.1 gp091 [Lactococcus phage KSY1]
MAILNFVKPGTFLLGTIVAVTTEQITMKKGKPGERIAEKLVTTFVSDDGGSYTAEHFMSDFDTIQATYASIGINIESDTDSWLNTRASLKLEDPRFGRVEIIGPAEGSSMPAGGGLSTANAVVPPTQTQVAPAQPVTPVQPAGQQQVALVQSQVAPAGPSTESPYPEQQATTLPGLG